MELKCNPLDSTLFAFSNEENIKIFKRQHDKHSPVGDWDINLPKKGIFNEKNSAKFFEWSVTKEHRNALAVGLNNGKVVMCWPDTEFQIGYTKYTKEFAPRFPRPCTSLAWNLDDHKLLACGLDRHRSDNSLFVWDIVSENSIAADFHYMHNQGSPSPAKTVSTKAQAEFGHAESVSSVIWLSKEPSTLITGMNGRTIRTYDIRTSNVQNNVNSKAVFGLCQDPFFDKRLASFVENQLFIWDTRNFTKAAAVINDVQNFVKVAWCPTRSGFIATLSNGISFSHTICVHDMKDAIATGSDRPFDISYHPLEQAVAPFKKTEMVSSFCWNEDKNFPNQLVSLSKSLKIQCSVAFERVSVSWNKNTSILSTFSGNNHICKPKTGLRDNNIVSPSLMKVRALSGYGTKSDNFKFKLQIQNDIYKLGYLWKWIKQVNFLEDMSQKTIVEQKTRFSSSKPLGSKQSLFYGLNYIIKSTQEDSHAENFKWYGIPNLLNMVYTSDVRSRILQICSWSSLSELNGADRREKFHAYLFREKDCYRAAAMAIWHLDMDAAIKVLNTNNSPCNTDLPLLAMALSGYTGDKKSNPLWKNMCTSLQYKLTNSYMKAICCFLSSQPNSGLYTTYRSFLEDDLINIEDRVGFACMYLSDENFNSYLGKLTADEISSGCLEGVLLTGLCKSEGIDLLESYVNKTADIQSVVLAILYTNDFSVLKHRAVQFWIQEYKNLLCTWKLWKECSIIQVNVQRVSNNQTKIRKDLVANCNYCQRPLTRNKFSGTSRGYNFMGQNPNVCAKCSKSLPRCSVCSFPPSNIDKEQNYSSNLLTWCQSCKHNGHADHLEAWFKDHTTCPISGCNCTCINQTKNKITH